MTKEEEFRQLLEQAVNAFPEFDWNQELPEGQMLFEADVNGGDLVDWFFEWREKVRTALGITERMRWGDVECSLCENDTSSRTAHLHQGKWICEDCWDERLKASE